MKQLVITCGLGFVLLLCSCMNENPESCNTGVIRMPINPNGDSELALLMRDLYEDGMKAKERIRNGEIPEMVLDFEKIHTAKATEPEKAASPEFQVYALSYLQAVKAMKNATPDSLESSYTDMVNACMNCHKVLCPGPIVKIEKMFLDRE